MLNKMLWRCAASTCLMSAGLQIHSAASVTEPQLKSAMSPSNPAQISPTRQSVCRLVEEATLHHTKNFWSADVSVSVLNSLC